jgi:hypothetical protein
MMDRDWQERSRLPAHCHNGHSWGPGQVTITWTPCDCSAALDDPGLGRLVVHCTAAGCPETWQTDADALIGAVEHRNRAAGGHRGPPAMAPPGAAWTLLAQAHDQLAALLRPAHPSAARIAGLRTWIQDCVSALDEAQRLETLVADDGDLAPVQEMAARLATVVDAFHIYASMLKTFRSNRQAALGPLSSPEPLAVTAENERELLRCRADLRESIQQLIAALRADR